MNGRRHAEGLLGWSALLAPLPLPLNTVLEWPVLALYLAFVALFLRSSGQRTLPIWAMNLLGLVYIPVLLVDLRMIFGRGQLVQTVVHLCMFAVVVKLFALRSRRDLWQTFGAVFFLFLASMGTSVHPSVVLYLLAFSLLAMAFLMRMAMMRVLVRFGAVEETLGKVSIRGFLMATTVAAVLASAPLFAIFPRLNAPMVGIRGTGTGTEIFSTGFTDEVSLDAIGRQRGNPQVALRLRYEGRPPDPSEIRLKGGSFDLFQGKRWIAASPKPSVLTSQGGTFLLKKERITRTVDIWQQPLSSKALLLPVETAEVELQVPIPILAWDRSGAVSMWRRTQGVLPYRVGLADGPVLTGMTPMENLTGPPDPTLDTDGLSDRARELASEVMGEGAPEDQAGRLLAFFRDQFTFSLDFMGRTGQAPLDDFLFDSRQGHCELFASSTVLMLRSRGIPARLVTGFLGADFNPLTGYFVVRQGNAHAWVEAYFEDGGWMLLDPTPPSGLPTSGGSRDGWSIFRQAWDYVQFRWDRYVLTYGFQDQASALWGLRKLWVKIRTWIAARASGKEGTEASAVERTPPADEASAEGGAFEEEAPANPLLMLPLVVALGLAGWLWRRQLRTRLSAQQAFRSLRRSLRRAGLELSSATAPGDLRRRAAERFPQAREPTGRVIDFYLRESFGGQTLSRDQRDALFASLKAAQQSFGRGKGSSPPEPAVEERRRAAG